MNCGCAATEFVGPPLTQTCGGGAFLLFMAALDSFIRKQCDLSADCTRVRAQRTAPEGALYDFVVIGGGSGGATAAGRLAELGEDNGWRVLLVEAGGDEPPGAQVPSMVVNYHGDEHLDWNYKTEPEPQACLGNPEHRCDWTRGKVLGGCSVLNGMMYMRGVPRDYDNWAKLGNKGWSYKDVLPFFKKSEDNLEIGRVKSELHGTGGPLTTVRFNDQPELVWDMLAGAKEMNFPVSEDLNKDLVGFNIAQSNTRDGSRLSAARAFLRPHRNNPSLHLMLNTTATRIIFSTVNNVKRATAVELSYKGRVFQVRVRKEVIVAGGAVNSPQVLLLSGVGPQEELTRLGVPAVHNLPGVGKNLQNHVTFYMDYELGKKQALNDLTWEVAMEYMMHRKGPMSSTGMSQFTARLNSKYADPSGNHPDLQMFFSGYLAKCASSGAINAPEDENHPHANRQLFISPVVLHPKSRGSITLKSQDPFEHPFIRQNYLTDPEDLEVLVDGIRLAQRLANSTLLREKYGIELVHEEYGNCASVYGYDSDDFWKCAVKHATGPENHQAGSCKMGPRTDRMAVVDANLKVHGLGNVRVLDASIMPAVVSGNTHATVVMIAEKGVEAIRAQWAPNSTFIGNRGGFYQEPQVSATSSSSSSSMNADEKKTLCDYPPPPPHHHHGFHNHHNMDNMPLSQRPYPPPYHPHFHRDHPHMQAGGHNPQFHRDHPEFEHDPEFHRNHPEIPNPFEKNVVLPTIRHKVGSD